MPIQLQTIRTQIAHLKAQLPPPRGKNPVCVLAAKGPRPADGPADTEIFLYWYYQDPLDLAALQARFDRDFGPATRGPNDPPCLFIRLTDAAEIEEQFKGTQLERGGVAS